MKNLWMMILLLAACIAASGCNTLRGVGQDVGKAGEAVEKAAD